MQRFKNILCIVAPEPADGAALERAVELAGNNRASLTVAEVIDEIPPGMRLLNRALWPADFQEKRVVAHQKELQDLVMPWNQKNRIHTRVLIGISFLEIIREVLRNKHDLVIKTAESGGLLDRVFGSDDMHLLRKCPCPVWLVKPGSSRKYRRIVVALDIDNNYPQEELETRHMLNTQILEMAGSLALAEFAELHVVHAWEDLEEKAMRHPFVDIPEEKITAYAEEARQQHKQKLNELVCETFNKMGQQIMEYLKPQTHLLKGSPRNEIPAFAEKIEADLVIMGTVARTGIPGFFMGNTAETILNRLDCSILAVKPPGFATPVTLG